ncbi:MAG: tandem-95 repeat protein [Bacteroidetes bacterium]|nr:tandem-95 repeat protein [Bacteroidota bacterium]
MKKPLTFLLSACLLFCANTVHASNYYFSSSKGNDSYSSSQAQNPETPWQSLNKLNSFFSNLQPGDSVLFLCGDTFYGNITINKSGTSSRPIVLASFGSGAKPIITGFSSIISWTNVGGNIWESSNVVTSSSNRLNMVSVNGAFQPIGRWPKITAPNQGYLNIDSYSGSTSITSNGLSGAPNFSGGQIVTRRNHWIIDVDNINSNSGSTVNFSNSDYAYGIQTNYGFFFQNHANACTQPGDWYYNASSRKLGIFSNGIPTGIQISTIDTLITVNYFSYITFKNLSFTGSNQITFLLTLAQNIIIDNCLISQAGQNAIVMTDAGLDQSKTQNISITNSTISYVNNNAINAKKAKNISITNSSITNVGMVAGMGLSGDGQYFGVTYLGDNATFSNNTVSYIGYSGVYFIGQNSTISNNFVHDFCMVKDDGAGIYTYASNLTGTTVSGNIVLNGIGNPYGTSNGQNYAEGIYADDETRNLIISGNTVANGGGRGIYIHNAHEIQLINNTCYNNNNNQIHFAHDDIAPSDPIRNINMKGNIFFSKTSDQTVARFSTISNDIQSFGVADNNYYARPINEPTTLYIPGTNNTLSGWKSFSGQDINSKASPKTITNLNDLRFEYNATSSAKVVNLGATYIDVTGKSYSGSITLQPYTSAVLIYQSGTVSNQSPTANAGPDQNFFLPTNSTTLNGSGTDSDGSIASYQWTKIAGPSQFTIVSPTQAQTVINNLVQGTYQFQLTVTDNLGATGSDTVVITVNAASNQLPTANAGPNQNITLPTNTVTINGSGSDPDGNIASYQWTKIAGPSQFTIVSPTQAQTVINNLVQGTYQFQLTVTDNLGATGSDTVVVTVNAAPNQAPTANAGANQNITLPTNTVTLLGSANDPDGTITSYSWSKISGPSQFTIVSPTQAQTVINNLVQGTYQFQLTVTDNMGSTATSSVTVTVNAAPNQLPIANAGLDQNITLPTNSVTLSGTGTDTDGTITAYRWRKISGPNSGSISNSNSAITTVTGLIQGVYQYELRVTDNNGAYGRDTMQVTVNPANIAPTANAGPNQNITLPNNSVSVSGSGSDPDGTIGSYQWSQISGPAQFTILSPNQAQTTINNLVQGTYQFQLTVTDNSGATGSDVVVITVNATANQSPVANAGSNQSITLPVNTVTLSGSGTDSDGTVISYQWTKVSGPSQYSIASPTQAQTTINNLVQGIYQFQLTVTDNSGSTGIDIVIITVNAAPNQPPVVDAGADQNITLPNNSVTLTGTANDPDGNIVSYLWSKISGPAQSNIVSVSQIQTVVNNLVQGVYQFQLSVTDNSGATTTDFVTITVNPAPNQPPTANAGTNISINLPVNSVTLSGSGWDADGNIASYQWTKISGPNQFNIVSSTQAQTVVNNLVLGVYQFQLTVTDNQGATGTSTVTVTVNPTPNQAPTANAGLNQNITLPTNTVTLAGSGNDPDGNIASYQWTKISGPNQFNIVSPAQAQTVINNLVQGVYQFQLKVTDNLGATGTATVTVTVNQPANQTPSANAGPDQTITLPVNSVTLSGSGTDPDGRVVSYSWSRTSGPSQFSIASPSQAQTIINNLVQGVYVFQLTVTDNAGATASDLVTITVKAAPPVPPTANAGNDQTIVLPANTITLSGSGSTPTGSISSYAWSQLSGPATSTIVSPTQSQTSVQNLIAGNYQFILTVTSSNGLTGKDTVQVTVQNSPNRNQVSATVKLYPNPASTIINLEITGASEKSSGYINIYDALGHLVYSENLNRDQFTITKQIDVSSFKSGIYFVTLTLDSNNKTTLKFVKQ